MISGKSVLAVVPARGGSKGLPNKNLRKIGGRSLVELAINFAMRCTEIDNCMLSTDSERIIEAAQRASLIETYRRPERLSGDLVGDVDVLIDAVLHFEQRANCEVGYVVMLQPTSPLRLMSEILDAFNMCVTQDLDSVWSVSEVDLKFHPDKQLRSDNQTLNFFTARGSEVIARQQLSPTFIRNGLFYIIARDVLIKRGSLLGERAGYVKIDREVVSIDTLSDLRLTRSLYRKHEILQEFEQYSPLRSSNR